MKLLVVVCLLVVTLTVRESLAQDAAAGDGTIDFISAGRNLGGFIAKMIKRKYSFLLHVNTPMQFRSLEST